MPTRLVVLLLLSFSIAARASYEVERAAATASPRTAEGKALLAKLKDDSNIDAGELVLLLQQMGEDEWAEKMFMGAILSDIEDREEVLKLKMLFKLQAASRRKSLLLAAWTGLKAMAKNGGPGALIDHGGTLFGEFAALPGPDREVAEALKNVFFVGPGVGPLKGFNPERPRNEMEQALTCMLVTEERTKTYAQAWSVHATAADKALLKSFLQCPSLKAATFGWLQVALKKASR